MNVETFQLFWKSKYPEAYPIGYELKWIYADRWFRIHSLPNSKRYAETEQEYQIILNRQNKLITDLIGEGTELVLLFLLSDENDLTYNNYTKITDYKKFHKVDTLNLHQIRSETFNEDILCDIFIKIIKWKSDKHNALLRLIADDEIKMMFICPEKNRIINPYDGGMDVIMETPQLRDIMKERYHKWLSKHPEGL